MATVELGRSGAQLETWDSADLVNPHLLFLGSSGVGKSHQIRRWCASLVATGIKRIHVFDPHGDLELDGASSVKFSQSSGFGLNPLMVNPDRDYGGTRRRINFVVAMINQLSRKLGPKQEAVLRALLSDVYAANGFYENDPSSWTLPARSGTAEKLNPNAKTRKNPALIDAIRFAKAKLNALYTGADSKAVAALEAVNRSAAQLANAARKLTGKVDPEASDGLDKLKQRAIDAYSEYVRRISSGRELSETLRYDSKDVLKGVIDRLENLSASGVFTPIPAPFDVATPIWHYDIRSLQEDEKALFTTFRLQQLLERARQRGIVNAPVEYAVVDEAHMLSSGADPDHPLNTIAREARKFGLGLICASQAATHFTEDFLANIATKVLLGLDPVHWPDAQRKMRIEEAQLRSIVSQRTCLVQTRTRGAAGSAAFRVLRLDR